MTILIQAARHKQVVIKGIHQINKERLGNSMHPKSQ
jgi:hypothetical protein